MSLSYPMLWLVLLVVFAGVEGLTAGLISIWFCAGSLAALFATIQKTNVDSILGSEGLVTEAIDNIRGTGQVKIGGILWTARSENGSPIEEGALVTVDRVEGVKVLVSVRNDSLS